MHVRFLGVSTVNDGSPTLYATDRNTYLVQGWKVEGRGRTHVEIPYPLLSFLEPGTCFSTRLEDTGKGTFVLVGVPVDDPAVLAPLEVPDHEQCVEVPMGVEIRPDNPDVVGVGAGTAGQPGAAAIVGRRG